jgi:hypothetical protein
MEITDVFPDPLQRLRNVTVGESPILASIIPLNWKQLCRKAGSRLWFPLRLARL